MKEILIFLCLIIVGVSSFPQPEKKTVMAIPTNVSLRIDGVLDEPIWKSAPAAIDFVQRQPFIGKPATYPTEVRFLYDNSGLYIGVTMFDPHPDSIPAQLGLRDATSLNSDNFIFIVSPFNDGLNAFCFLVYASDVQTDFKLAADGDDDYSWDAVWISKARKNDQGWVVEMKIPYSAIRFPIKPVQEWGINCQRQIRRYREIDTWNLVDSKVSGYVNQSGLLEGIKDITPPLRLSVSPYLSGYLQNSPGEKTYDLSYNYGADLKYGVNQSFTLDMTLIPDFGQVRSDDKVYNFSPYEIRYDERRQFFTEGTELFNKGGIFYSRRVGSEPKAYGKPYDELSKNEQVTDNPSQTKLINATKISGRTSSGMGLGFFNAMSANTWATIRDTVTGKTRRILTQGFTNYNTLILDQNLKNNSYIDFLNTNYFMPTEGYTANVTGTSFKFANNKYTYAFTGDGFISQRYYAHGSPDLGYRYSLSFGKIAGNYRFDYNQLLETDTYNPNDMGFNVTNNRFNNTLFMEYSIYEPFWKLLNWHNYAQITYKNLYKDLRFSSLEFYAESNAMTRRQFWFGVKTNFSPIASHDYYEPRVDGWMYLSPANGNLNLYISSDYSKTFALDASITGYVAPKIKSSGYSFILEPRYRINDRIMLLYHFTYEMILNDIGYVDTITGPSGNLTIYFGRRDRQNITNVLEASYMITSNMSLNLRARHYWISAPYYDFSSLQQDGLLKRTDYLKDPDVNYNLFNLDLSYTWNFAAGSQISIMWKNAINTMNNNIEPDFFRDFRETMASAASNSFSIRILYFLDALYLKKNRNS